MNERLKKIRKLKGFTPKEMADRLGISYRSIQNYELKLREIPSRVVALISTRLGINPNWLLTGEGEMTEKIEGYGVSDKVSDDTLIAQIETGMKYLMGIIRSKNDDVIKTTLGNLKMTYELVKKKD